MNPITVDELRADWLDAPGLTDEERQTLSQLPDGKLQEALAMAFSHYQDMYLFVLDSTRGDATQALLEQESV